MREIKFRAWSHLWKEAVGVLPVLTIDFVNRAVYVLPERELEGGNQEEWLFGEIDLMQYTGLKDRNGKEIYEGDRLGFTINFSDESARAYWSESGFTGLVYWDKSGWAINEIVFQKMFNVTYVFSMQGREFDQRLLERYSKIKSNSFDNITDFEVIGNIYENHDLL